ncbi:carboxypeptidase-like regulatory domain-containing protein [Hyunsoonleella flava]|uniref:Carboxypeptidase-like regulatory domain-containing protein n=1 Tax=Hyunsoonleella flava TaxID=2527939 RepID=A0A4Q9FB67_9FLAO|nr:carboxypeptidase-like regulatory domain-containing protein [Hyunsoonleella flava]TBN01872.1 carboxypeptidase-like regulatory domain-containing protein [Hyunsoonleella flava]
MRGKLFSLLFLLHGFVSYSQIIKGTVLDAKTKAPIETATVYFDNTTIGAITNSKGEFTIKYSDAIQSPLIISFLGYKKQVITDYREKNTITVFLEENHESLNEVIVNANDGLTRKQKLRFFRKEFLGTSRFGKSCTILNEEDIILRYDRKQRVLRGYSKSPIRVENKALQYYITYDLTSFILRFMPRGSSNNTFDVRSVGFFGSTYYKDFEIFNKEKAIKNRNKAYAGSRLQFMRALYAQKFAENKFQLFFKSTRIEDPWEYIYIETKNGTEIKRVSLRQPLNILFNNWEKSSIEFLAPSIFIDFFGNYTNVDKVRFTGVMGEQRVGELLPFDYGL